MNSRYSLTTALAFFIIFSCKDNQEQTIGRVLPEFQIYVDRFVAEAKARGIAVNIDNLNADFGEYEDNVCGTGNSKPARITVYKSCWVNLPDMPREILVFHQLGHAILGRSHNNERFTNGTLSSIMSEDILTLYNAWVPAVRSYYLDELFNPSTPTPFWTLPKTKETTVLKDQITKNSNWSYAFSSMGNPNHVGSIIDSVSSSPPNSLSIQSNTVSTAGFSYWVYSWKPSNIEEGADVLFKVKIKAKNITGKGAYFAVRADINNEMAFFYSTEGKIPITGNTDFQEYSLPVNYFPNSSPTVSIFLILDGASKGIVYFDDIEVIKYY